MRYAKILSFSLCALFACAEPQVIRQGTAIPRSEAVDRDLNAARSAWQQGKDADARRLLERFLDELGDTRRSDEARFLLGEVYLRSGEAERAALTWRRLVERAPLSRLGPEARLRAAKVYRDLGQSDTARRMLDGLDMKRAPEALRPELYRTQADLSRAVGDFSGAVIALAQSRDGITSDTDRSTLDLEIGELLRDRLRDDELDALIARVPAGAVRDRAGLELARRRIGRGEFPSAVSVLQRLPAQLAQIDERTREELLAQAERGSQTRVYPLGLAVPLSGSYGPFGRSVLRGVSLALDLFGPSPDSYRLVIRDTGGDAEKAQVAVRELVGEGVRAIIGPMRSSSVTAAAPIAEQAGIPMLSFGVRPDSQQGQGHVFRVGVTPREQVASLVDFAMQSFEARRFAVMYPKDPYGIEYKNLFWEEVERRGGEVVGVEGYKPGAVDLQDEIRRLVGLYYITPDEKKLIDRRDKLSRRREENREELAKPELADLPPYVDFDALFIPDIAVNVGVILPQLRFYDVTGVRLLGTNDWNDPKLVELAAKEAEDAVFVDTFHAQSADPRVKQFVERFYAEHGVQPDVYAAQGYEIASLLRTLVGSSGGAATSEELTRALLAFPQSAPGFQSVAGLKAFDGTGGSVRDLSVLTVIRRQIDAFDAEQQIKNRAR